MKTLIITGANSGLGFETAKKIHLGHFLLANLLFPYMADNGMIFQRVVICMMRQWLKWCGRERIRWHIFYAAYESIDDICKDEHAGVIWRSGKILNCLYAACDGRWHYSAVRAIL